MNQHVTRRSTVVLAPDVRVYDPKRRMTTSEVARLLTALHIEPGQGGLIESPDRPRSMLPRFMVMLLPIVALISFGIALLAFAGLFR